MDLANLIAVEAGRGASDGARCHPPGGGWSHEGKRRPDTGPWSVPHPLRQAATRFCPGDRGARRSTHGQYRRAGTSGGAPVLGTTDPL